MRSRMIRMLAFALLFTVGQSEGGAPWDARVLLVKTEPQAFADARGEPDFGYMVRATVQNRGTRGVFVVTATLSCSEGEWASKRTVLLENEQTDEVKFAFPQPTLSAQDVKSRVGIAPEGER